LRGSSLRLGGRAWEVLSLDKNGEEHPMKGQPLVFNAEVGTERPPDDLCFAAPLLLGQAHQRLFLVGM
jgi:hypothetical protein